mmetsp:Transcript_58137/g.112152  ORF Transcript_58137/g.112152 Transcript_58137/m.112152 type:complete len:378 (-) Transcript_58137:58-1191(-)|eukprot:CAMPEP_0172683262 /NCGR_PEP_ID=MMETSP1074-20121228/18738_1 /TAXON_ID=2916 /ORGANISM="Ceratium fusus, Strain PA161109" /LENGTH=377 /DNA_ID=CAMNT_0013502089 /DNA_START=75 /DNA_END=1211 /DNA_ORIENTATION=-
MSPGCALLAAAKVLGLLVLCRHLQRDAFVGSRRLSPTAGARCASLRASIESRIGAVNLKTIPGQKAQHLLFENPALFEYAFDEEFSKLGSIVTEMHGTLDAAASERQDNATVEASLERRKVEVCIRSCQHIAVELLYVAVCARFHRLGVSLWQPLQANGRVQLVPAPIDSLTTAVHSATALKAVEDHVANSFSFVGALPGQLIQIPSFSIGQAYAMSVLFGYVLRRGEQHLKLEQMMGGSHNVDMHGSALLQYIEKAIGPGDFQDKMTSVEAQEVTKAQVSALFGDLQLLREATVRALQNSPDIHAAVQRGEVSSLSMTVAEVRQLLLEATAFGALLHETEDEVRNVYELTPSLHSGLDSFGVDVDAQGRVQRNWDE